MNHKLILAVAMLVFASFGSRSAIAVTYKAIDLNPSGFASSESLGVSGSQQVGYGSGSATGGKDHALLWSGSAGTKIDLHPGNYVDSQAFACFGNQQVGYGSVSTDDFDYHALLWTGSAGSVIDLNNSSFFRSQAYGTCGTQQVGVAFHRGPHAMLWNSSPDDFVDLHPASGFVESYAYATDGTHQSGYGLTDAIWPHALLWSGSSSSCVDLNPEGYRDSYAYGLSGAEQVGFGTLFPTPSNIYTYTHALLWHGSATDYDDLNPSTGFTTTRAWATNGTQQVGEGSGSATGDNAHALVWNGTADDYVDLHQYLPSGFTASHALAIDSLGNIAGYATDAAGNNHAIFWSPVPEPSTFVLLGMSVIGLFAWLRQRGRKAG